MFFFNKQQFVNNLQESRLFDETSFYPCFINDLLKTNNEVIIESPFIAYQRMQILHPIFKKLLVKGIRIHIFTRDPIEHDEEYRYRATEEILECSKIGINVILISGNLHRKLAIIDKSILWEGSLNILSQWNSKEIMRRIENKYIAKEMLKFLTLH